MQIKDLIIRHTNGYIEVKEPVKIRAMGSESVILPVNGAPTGSQRDPWYPHFGGESRHGGTEAHPD